MSDRSTRLKKRNSAKLDRVAQELKAYFRSFPEDVQSIIREDAGQILELRARVLAEPKAFLVPNSTFRTPHVPWTNRFKSTWLEHLADDYKSATVMFQRTATQIRFSAQALRENYISREVFVMHLDIMLEWCPYFCRLGSGWHGQTKLHDLLGPELFHEHRHKIIAKYPNQVCGLDWKSPVVHRELRTRYPDALARVACVCIYRSASIRHKVGASFPFALALDSVQRYPFSLLAIPRSHSLFEHLCHASLALLSRPLRSPVCVSEYWTLEAYVKHVPKAFWRKNQMYLEKFFRLGFGTHTPNSTVMTLGLAVKLLRFEPRYFRAIERGLHSTLDAHKQTIVEQGVKLMDQRVTADPESALANLFNGRWYFPHFRNRFVELAVTNLCCKCRCKKDCCVEVLAQLHKEHGFLARDLRLLFPFLKLRKRGRSEKEISSREKIKRVRDLLKM